MMRSILLAVLVVGCGGAGDLSTSSSAALPDGGALHPLVASGTIVTGNGAVPTLTDAIGVSSISIGPSTSNPLFVSAVKVILQQPPSTGLLPSSYAPETLDPVYQREVWSYEYSDRIEFILTDASRNPVDPRTSPMKWTFEIRRIRP